MPEKGNEDSCLTERLPHPDTFDEAYKKGFDNEFHINQESKIGNEIFVQDCFVGTPQKERLGNGGGTLDENVRTAQSVPILQIMGN